MKKLMVAALALITALTFTACSKDDSTNANQAVAQIDTSSVTRAFERAPADVRTDLERAITAIQGGNHADALAILQRLEGGKLTPEQRDSIQAVISKIQGALANSAGAAAK